MSQELIRKMRKKYLMKDPQGNEQKIERMLISKLVENKWKIIDANLLNNFKTKKKNILKKLEKLPLLTTGQITKNGIYIYASLDENTEYWDYENLIFHITYDVSKDNYELGVNGWNSSYGSETIERHYENIKNVIKDIKEIINNPFEDSFDH